MRIFLFVDGWIGAQILKILNHYNENIIGIAVHPIRLRNNYSEIIQNSELIEEKFFSTLIDSVP